jgi:presequence protease
MVRHLIGVTDAGRQRIRDEVLSTTPAHFKAFADVLSAVQAHGQVVILGSKEALEAANPELNHRLQITKVL